MCGLAGFIDSSQTKGEAALRDIASRMAETLRHRGPNDAGTWADAAAGFAVGFRRLSILDLSPEGHQPMPSADGRYVLAFNGEIYNHRALRAELEREGGRVPPFRGRSDTEVILAAVQCWGLLEAVRRFTGMFALALWDRKEQALHLLRDRLGEKPLYYGWMGQCFLFASELKALRAHPDFDRQINRDALIPYLRLGYIPAPYSVYKGTHKLLPGSMLTLDRSHLEARALPRPSLYWSAAKVFEDGARNLFSGDEVSAADHLEKLLRGAIRDQMVADVPVGAFLSGGIDSSTVVAMMQAESTLPVRTFTIGFNEAGCDEAAFAHAVARHVGTEHTELYVSPRDALEVIPRLPCIYDEPFADCAQIPLFLVSQLARRAVTVSLSGDGGDELLGGYSWHLQTGRIWNRIGWMPRALRAAAASALTVLSPQGWDRTLNVLEAVLPTKVKRQVSGDRVHKLADLMREATDPESVYRSLVSKWNGSSAVVLQAHQPEGVPLTLPSPPGGRGSSEGGQLSDLVQRMLWIDMTTYLPDDHMTKVDRATMAVSLEARAPFLDHRVVEFVWRLPLTLKLRNGQGKYLLRQVLYRYVPPKLVDRPKMGFPVPIDSWLRGPLRAWADDLLREDRLRREGFLNPAPIRQKWLEHSSGSRNWQHHLWYVLMFQAWLANE